MRVNGITTLHPSGYLITESDKPAAELLPKPIGFIGIKLFFFIVSNRGAKNAVVAFRTLRILMIKIIHTEIHQFIEF